MKTMLWCVFLAVGAMAIGCMSAKQNTSSSVSQVTGRDDLGITGGMTVAEVESKLGKPNDVKPAWQLGNFTGPTGQAYFYNKPEGIFLVYFDTKGKVASAGWMNDKGVPEESKPVNGR